MLMSVLSTRAAAIGLAGSLALSASALAADATPPMKIPLGQKDLSTVDGGTYTMDPNHMGILAHVSHLGFSVSVFRFGAAKATLDWDAKDHAKSKLSATVETNSIETNVPGFAEELQGDQYLDAKKFPEATFVSTAFRQTDAQHGDVDGNFTLRGVTRPATFHVSLVGAGPGFAGGPQIGHVIGIHAETAINGADYGLPHILSMQPIELTIDTEFDKPS
jgi:polyisoprenoid-binding protein YceI